MTITEAMNDHQVRTLQNQAGTWQNTRQMLAALRNQGTEIIFQNEGLGVKTTVRVIEADPGTDPVTGLVYDFFDDLIQTLREKENQAGLKIQARINQLTT